LRQEGEKTGVNPKEGLGQACPKGKYMKKKKKEEWGLKEQAVNQVLTGKARVGHTEKK